MLAPIDAWMHINIKTLIIHRYTVLRHTLVAVVCSSFVDSVSQRETENARGVLGRSKQARNTACVDTKHTHTRSLPCSNWAAQHRHTFIFSGEGGRVGKEGEKTNGGGVYGLRDNEEEGM